MSGGQITGKALMLDEIINYVQSLQRQVEVTNMGNAAEVQNNRLNSSHLNFLSEQKLTKM
jgi:hypothetical protein